MALVAVVVLIGSAEHLPIKSYTWADGLGIGAVKRIVRDANGFLWFCTQSGLSRFDGTQFVSHSVESTGIPFSSTNDLLESDGAYWVATNAKGVWRVGASSISPTSKIRSAQRGHAVPQYEVYPVGDEPASNRVNVLYRDAAGRLWAGTDAGLFRMDDMHSAGKFYRVPLRLASHPDRLVNVWSLVGDRDGSIWAGTRFGLVRIFRDGGPLALQSPSHRAAIMCGH